MKLRPSVLRLRKTPVRDKVANDVYLTVTNQIGKQAEKIVDEHLALALAAVVPRVRDVVSFSMVDRLWATEYLPSLL